MSEIEENKANEIKNKIKELQEKYNSDIATRNPADISRAYELIEECRVKTKRREYVNLFDEAKKENDNVKEIFDLLKKFRDEIKQLFVSEEYNLTHITEYFSNDLDDGLLKVSKNRDDHYQVERGDFFFASSAPLDGTNLYMARRASFGMISRKKACIYGDNDIFKIGYDIDGNRRLLLRNPNCVYEIKPEKFTPTVMLVSDKNGKPCVHFSEEWRCGENINNYDIVSIYPIKDVTSILERYQIFTVNDPKKLTEFIDAESKGEVKKFIKENLKNGQMRYINGMMNINVDKDIQAANAPELDER